MRRSKHIRLSLMAGASAVLAIGLSACSEEPVDVSLFETVDGCIATGNPAESCEAAFREARAVHEASAPRFADEAACEEEFGAGQCQVQQAAADQQAAGDQQVAPDQQAGGGGFFMPLMMGYMMGSLLSGPSRVAPQPLYRQGDAFTTPNGQTVARGNALPRNASVQPSTVNRTASRAVQRGGFGTRAFSAGG